MQRSNSNSNSVSLSLAPSVSLVASPLEPPRVVRHCPRCGCHRPFASSGGFRVNAQKRRLDVWLVRRCAECELTWNQPVHERVTPAELGERLARYQGDEPDTVHAVAFDELALRRFGAVEPATFRVDPEPRLPLPPPPFAARIVLARPFAARLDRVLCAGLGLSRSRLRALAERGLVATCGPLDRDAIDGSIVGVEALDPSSAHADALGSTQAPDNRRETA